MAASSKQPARPAPADNRRAITTLLETLEQELAAAQRLAADLFPTDQLSADLADVHAHLGRALGHVRSEPRTAPAVIPTPPRSPSDPSNWAAKLKAKSAPLVQLPCPHCGSLIPERLLADHIRRKHPGPQPAPRTRKRGSGRRGGAPTRTRYVDPSYDPYDGGRSLSESRREGGCFGSLPLYDSFDEESNP